MFSIRTSAAAGLFAVLAVGAGAAHATPPLKVGFVYIGPASGAGWSYAHELAREEVQRTYGDKVQTVFVENVQEGAASEHVLRTLADEGAQVIFATAIGYLEPVVKTARDYPDVAFEQATGYKTGRNLGIYDIRTYEGACLTGTLAGAMTRTNTLGVVGSLPVPEVIRNINAFTLCAQAVNPKVRTKVVWVNGWYDPPKEHAAADTLIGMGADVLMQNTDSPTTVQVAHERGIYGFGWDTDMSKWGGDSQLAASTLHWSVFYNKVVAEKLAGTWKPGSVWLGLKDDAIRFGSYSRLVPERLRQLVEARKKDIVSGMRPVFKGPLKDQSGTLRVAAGVEPNDEDKLKMNYFVQGVDGVLGK